MRIGIDIGGTHTDGVLIDGDRLIAAAKAPTLGDNLLESLKSQKIFDRELQPWNWIKLPKHTLGIIKEYLDF